MDTIFDYRSYRNFLSEQDCITLINMLKEKSGKKVAIIFGNCQTQKLIKMFLNHSVFSQEYFLVQLPPVFNYREQDYALLEEHFWSVCDLLISHRVKKDNRFNAKLATQRFTSYLPETSKVIWIPNVYFNGYFPQYKDNEHNIDRHLHQSGRFPYGDKYIDAYLEDNVCTLQELSQYIQSEAFITENEVKANVERSFNELRKREWPCDIHMSDYIVDNYQRKQLFYSNNHPIQSVILELAYRILRFMDISDLTFTNMDFLQVQDSLIGQDVPIYPAVKKILNLKDSLEEYYPNRYLWPFRGNYLDYLTEYVKWCWKERLITNYVD